jgi:sugar phosphate isomerase/epimerase
LGNWASDLTKPFDEDLAATHRAAARARRLGAEFIRIMSYPIGDPANLREEERFRRLREIVAVFAGSGTTVVHENCSNYGGMSWRHSLKLLENVPGLKLVFDMGNCAGDLDYLKPEPRPRQNAWEFYQKVRDHVAYVHIKDAMWDPNLGENRLGFPMEGKKRHVFPGEGTCHVRAIVADLRATGYSSGLSIEPHMGAGLPASELTPETNAYETYVEYGRRLMRVAAEITAALVGAAS